MPVFTALYRERRFIRTYNTLCPSDEGEEEARAYVVAVGFAILRARINCIPAAHSTRVKHSDKCLSNCDKEKEGKR